MDECFNIDVKNITVAFPALKALDNTNSNLEEIGLYMIKKRVLGKSGNKLIYSSHAMVHYNEPHLSVGAKKVDSPDSKLTVWKQVKQEFYDLICTKDRKYTKIRSKLFTCTKQLSNTIVFTVSAIISKSIGVAVGVISGAVAALFFALATMGISVYCKLASNS